jgi:hypothetical protein
MIFLKIVKLKPYACGNCGPHQAAFHAPGLPRSCSIRLPVALLLEKHGEAEVWFHLHFFGHLENYSRLPGRRRNSPLTLRVGMHGGSSDAYRSHIYRCRRDHAGRGS